MTRHSARGLAAPQPHPQPEPGLEFLSGGGEMGRRMRAYNWARSPLGDAEAWPQSLKTIIRVMLDSRYAMWMLWGPEFTFFCNDAYLPTVGDKENWVLGARSDKVWEEIWPDIGPRIERVLKGGPATWDEGLLLFLERTGFPEETYHTFSYSPVYDDQSRVAGMLCVVTEVTERVIGERRLHILRALAGRASDNPTVEETCRKVIQVLGQYPLDLPLAALYLADENDGRLHLVAATRHADEAHLPARAHVGEAAGPWRFEASGGGASNAHPIDLTPYTPAIAAGPWPDALKTGFALALKSGAAERLVGFLLVCVSPRRPLDAGYRDFLDILSGQVAATLADARASEQERARADALAEIDRAKTHFFSNVSHEFRTPITLMLGPLQDLLADPGITGGVRDRLAVAQRNALRLLKLVNSLLDFSRLEVGRMRALFEPTDLAALTRDLASTFRSAIEGAALDFEVDVPTLPEPVFVDREMWEKIVLNLLSNAFKFTLEGGITVRLGAGPEAVRLEVADTGVGIAAEEMPHLFERFHRIEGSRGRTLEGSGIGLALVQELVKLHGGSLTAQSEPGVGTSFVVTIPRGSAHLPPERVRLAAQPQARSNAFEGFVQEATRWLPDPPAAAVQDDAGVALGAGFDRRFEATYGARIVLADDNADMRVYLSGLVAPHYRVELVPDGQAALDAIRREPPELLISDVMMPRLDGLGLLRTLRLDPQLRDLPVILLSARAGEEARVEGFDAGADDYIVKPFIARELLARIGAILERARVRREGEARLKESQARLKLALDAALAIGVWDYDIASDRMHVDARMAELFRLPEAATIEGVPLAHFLAGIDAEDRPRVERATRASLAGGAPFDIEFRIAAAPGEPGWLLARGGLALDASGAAGRFSGIAVDITQRKDAARELRLASERLATTVAAAEVSSWVWHLKENRLVADENLALLFALSDAEREAIVPARLAAGVHPDDRGAFEEALAGAAHTGRFVALEFRVVAADGRLRWQMMRGRVVSDAQGHPDLHLALLVDITERKNLETALKQSDSLKDEFLAMLAHELRNPLAPIRSANEVLRRLLPPDRKVHDLLAIVSRQTAQLARLVDDLLDVSRITKGRIELQRAPLDLGQVVMEAVETVEPMVESRGHKLTVVTRRQPLWVVGDHARLVQCVVNLLNNAAKYTETGGRIEVELDAEERLVRLSISDSGIGISAALLPRIFDLFVQGDRTLDRAQGGLGIGLSVVQRLIDMHGGAIVAKSAGPGQGSTFEVRLPRIARPAPGPASPEAPAAAKRRVLVVDDNVDSAVSLALMLELQGHVTAEAYTSHDALARAAQFRPDVVLLDIGLPEVDGYEVARRLRALPGLAGVRLVAVTGYGQPEDVSRARAAGFDRHLVKPVDLAALASALGEA